MKMCIAKLWGVAWMLAILTSCETPSSERKTNPPDGTEIRVMPNGKVAVVKIIPPTPPISANESRVRPVMKRKPGFEPGEIPPEVRYVFASDDAVAAADEIVTKAFTTKDGPSAYAADVALHPGVWSLLKQKFDPPTSHVVPEFRQADFGNQRVVLPSARVKQPAEREKLAVAMRTLLEEEGGFTTTALESMDMRLWWPMIYNDIKEPVFRVKSAKGRYVFIVVIEHGKITEIEEMRELFRLLQKTPPTAVPKPI